MRYLLLATVLFVAGCAIPTTFYTESDTEIRIVYGGGGFLKAKLRTYERIYDAARTGKQVIIDGPMISADAFYAFGIPGVCYTENAVWSPHAVSQGGLYRLGRETDIIMQYLPEPMKVHFRASPSYWNFVLARDVGYDELLTIWPLGACDQEDSRQPEHPS